MFLQPLVPEFDVVAGLQMPTPQAPDGDRGMLAQEVVLQWDALAATRRVILIKPFRNQSPNRLQKQLLPHRQAYSQLIFWAFWVMHN